MRTEYRAGQIYYHIERDRHSRRCASCGARWWQLTLAGRFRRLFRALPVGRQAQWIVLHGHLHRCKACGRVLREPVSFARGRRRHTLAFERYVVALCAIAPIKHVAGLLKAGWDLVKEIYKAHLVKRLKRRKLKKVRYIAIDEFSVRKGHQYMTVVLDLQTGVILFAQHGKNAASLIPFLQQLKKSQAKLKAVAIDMSEAFIQAVQQLFPEVDIVHDPYHVVALANKAVDATRRDLCQRLSDERRSFIKGSRFLLLRGLETLSPNGLERLMKLMELNEPLYQAYLLKEDLRLFWNLPHKQAAQSFLNAWIEQAQALGNKHLEKLAKTLQRHRLRLLNYFEHRISTGPLEGLNNKIKVLKRQAYGFRDFEYFKLRLYFLHEDILCFSG